MGMYQIIDETASYFNKNVYDNVVNSIDFKVWQFVEKANDIQVKQSFKIDMRKCRRNLTYFCKYEFPVYSVMDSPKSFTGEIRSGLYYIITTNTFPFRGTGWYHEPLLRYGLENGIINKDEIKLEFIPCKTLPNYYFQENIDTLLTAFESESQLQKLCVNAYIGLMGRTKRTFSKSKFTLCPIEESEWWCSNDDNNETDKSVFIRNHTLDNKEILYEGIESQNIISEATTYPIYAMILQMEAMELHKLETNIKNYGGIILDRNTDAIRYAAKNEMDITQYFWDAESKVSKYQTEKSKPLEIEQMSNFCRNPTLDLKQFILNWNIIYDYENSADEKAKLIVDSNTSYHIDGRAGTGKSYLTNKVIEELKKENKKYLAFSPTNKGARIIGGKTIHSVYYKFKHNKNKLLDMLKK